MRKWLVMFSAGIMLVLINVDMTVVNLALAPIAKDLHITLVQTQWVVNAYLLATTALFTLFGRMADNFGKKYIFLAGVVVFTIASLIAGLTTDFSWLVIARFLQGIGFAATLGLSISIIVSSFPEEQHGFATGMAVTISGAAQALGPTIGGMILQSLDWHWIFLINVPLGCISFLGTLLVLANDRPMTQRAPIHMSNVVIFGLGNVLTIYSLNELPELPFYIFVSLLATGVFMLVWFFRRCLRIDNPLIDVKLLRHRGYVAILMIRMMMMYFMSSMLFVMPLFMQNMLDYSPMKTGMIMFFMGIFVAMSAPIVGRTIDRFGFRSPLILSSAFGFIASTIFGFVPLHPSIFTLLFAFVCYGLAVGIHLPSSINGALSQASAESKGTAIGLFFTVAIGGSVIGVSISGAIINFVSRLQLAHYLVSHHIPLSASLYEGLRQAANGTYNLAWVLQDHVLSAENLKLVKVIVHASFYAGLHEMAWVMAVLTGIALFISLRLKSFCKDCK